MLFRGEKDQTFLITIWLYFFFQINPFHAGIRLKGQTCIIISRTPFFPCVMFTHKKTIKPINKFYFVAI